MAFVDLSYFELLRNRAEKEKAALSFKEASSQHTARKLPIRDASEPRCVTVLSGGTRVDIPDSSIISLWGFRFVDDVENGELCLRLEPSRIEAARSDKESEILVRKPSILGWRYYAVPKNTFNLIYQ